MNSQTEKRLVPGPAGQIEVAIDLPAHGSSPVGTALICHPNPTQGGTMDNKVVQTLARAFIQLGWRAVRFNFRGIGKSEGGWDEGRGEVDDALAVLDAVCAPGEALILSGFSFGGYVASRAAQRIAEPAQRLVLVGPATSRFDTAPVPADTVVIHGEVDDVVPLASVLDWARPQSLPVTVVPGVGHFFHGQLPLLKSLVIRAFDPARA
ncbi:alpha/beta fold hydrolase [Roseateles asaccharophilus]|uniref:Alpha/beta superfamily hydrolase n=1 Tax=Roseateles asaccharophilus TaxID=582607 RepID=A0ABU2AEI9_9BURK|nr:alpha/beta fold hydrolase [Roseateles asaccharophilus]MDR7335606.1 alpha/beta superfamily hydrolase [Roseateles asaccharophilus]